MSKSTELPGVPADIIERRIYLIRGRKVMLDSDLAFLYQVLTKNLNKAVKRNLNRFPEDFMFQLTQEEAKSSRFQTGTLKKGRGSNVKYLPYAFTELGVAMLSSVLNSERAVMVNIAIMRAFVKLRELLIRDKDLATRVEKLEVNQKDHRSMIAILVKEIDELKSLPDPKNKRIM